MIKLLLPNQCQQKELRYKVLVPSPYVMGYTFKLRETPKTKIENIIV